MLESWWAFFQNIWAMIMAGIEAHRDDTDGFNFP